MVLLGASALITGVTGLVDRSSLTTSAIGRSLDGIVDDVWLFAYTLGGVLVLAGVARVRPDLEVAGEWLLVAAVCINAGAILIVRGPIGGLLTAGPVVLAGWVIHGRIRFLEDVARADRRHGAPDERPPADRIERRGS